MTFAEYQQEALKTADERNTLEYCCLGLTNEAGEAMGPIKKHWRGDYGEDVMKEKLIDELGDVLWYAAVLFDRYTDVGPMLMLDSLPPLSEISSSYRHKQTFYQKARELCRSANHIANMADRKDYIDPLYLLIRIQELSNGNLETIALCNIEKLRDRQARGVLYGDGDKR